jgi:hypothetical protein
MPCLVVLDLNLPRVSGLGGAPMDPLATGARRFARHCVFVVKSMAGLQGGAYELRIDTYVTKPLNFNEWVAMVGALKVHWLKGR